MRKLYNFIIFILLAFSITASGQNNTGKKQSKPALLVVDIQNEYLP